MNRNRRLPDLQTVAWYMGLHGKPGEQAEEIDRWTEQMATTCVIRSATVTVPVMLANDIVILGTQPIQSHDLAQTLCGCEKAVILAATLGSGIDRMVMKTEKISSAGAFCLQAAAAAMIEKVGDELASDLRVQYEKQGLATRNRYAPGYGDFSLENQTVLLRMLQAGRRIGLSETSAHMLLPLKSITGIIGIGNEPETRKNGKCERCLMTDCAWRRKEDINGSS